MVQSTGFRTDRRYTALQAIPPVEREETEAGLRITRVFRGMHLDQAIGYLESLGGERLDDETVSGLGWVASLSAAAEPVGPSYRLTTVRITWTGDADAVEEVVLGFRLRAFRAPG